jgi:hypothetical protein
LFSILSEIVKAVQMLKRIEGNLKAERILLNERGHLKVINTMSSPEEITDGMEERFTRSSLKRFYGTSTVTKRPKS